MSMNKYKCICTTPTLSTLQNEIKNNTVYYMYIKNNFYFYIDRGEWNDFYFYINDTDVYIPKGFSEKPLIITFIDNIKNSSLNNKFYREFFNKNEIKLYSVYQNFTNTNLEKKDCPAFPKKKYTICLATNEDVESILSLMIRYLKRYGRPIPNSQDLRKKIQNKEVFIVKRNIDNTVVATKVIAYNGKMAADQGIAVEEFCRGEHIAKALTLQSFQWIKEHGCIRTDAWIERKNTPSMQLHLTCGYVANSRLLIKYIRQF